MNNELGIRNIFLYIGLLGLSLFVGNIAHAENEPVIYFNGPGVSFAPESEFSVIVLIDSSKPINAFDLEINYPSELLFVRSLNNAESIINFWRGNPNASQPGLIKLQGGASEAFSGRSGKIIEINFSAKEEGVTNLSFGRADIYYADGLGTRAEVQSLVLGLNISKSGVLLRTSEVIDDSPPVISETQIAKNPGDNTRLVIFAVEDKGSGVESTYIRSKKWFSWDEWQLAANPHKLAAGIWAIELRALDNKGNASLQKIYIWEEIIKKFGIFAAIMLAIYLFTKSRFRLKKKML